MKNDVKKKVSADYVQFNNDYQLRLLDNDFWKT